MTTFDEREKGFEAKYKLDQEAQFKVTNRRNRLLGQWAAGQLGISGGAADSYAKEVVAADFVEKGDNDVVNKVLGDFKAKGVAMDEARLRKQMNTLLDQARTQILAETGKK